MSPHSPRPAALHPDLGSWRRFEQLPPEAKETLVRSDARAPASLAERARILVMLGRPRTCVPGMLAYALGLAYVDPPLTPMVLVGYLLCFLGGFVANLGNTYTDLAEDCRNLPGRVYLVAKLGYRPLFRVLLACYGLMLAGAAVFGPIAFILMIVALAAVHEYSFPPLRAKDSVVTGLVVFAQVVAFPFFVACFTDPDGSFVAALTGAGSVAEQASAHRFIAMLVFVELWFIAKGFYKNVPDYYGDRAAGVRTSATLFSSWRAAATVSAVITVVTYASLAVLVVLGREPARLLVALVWLVPVTWNCWRLVRADDGARGNQCLKIDMVISCLFIATVLVLVAPSWTSALTIAAGVAVIVASDLLRIDSRRAADAADAAQHVRSAHSRAGIGDSYPTETKVEFAD